ncbi:FtsX-like permease family protein [Streptomyces sp. NPDC058953]|uniref:FtsX-like permease family protein n=1 Tax=Streptomyces sp. NPDC058953 TaxID=3346676 RepID=UPI0036A04E0D
MGHPWSTAAFAPYVLTAGRAPERTGEVVVTGDWTRPGAVLRTARGQFTVVGTAGDLGFENAVFLTDRQAAELSPRVDQVVVSAPRDRVLAAIAPTRADRGSPTPLRLLTGPDRRHADPDPDRDADALVTVNALLGTAAGMTGFVSVLVTAAAFSFAVTLRRREFALLRTAGATPGRIRRTVLTEALAVGTVAAAAGCALGDRGAPLLIRYLVANGLAPPWFTLTPAGWPYHVAFWTGLLAALAGGAGAAWRAGRTGPLEALRDASADRRRPTSRTRLTAGAVLLLAAVGTAVYALFTDPGDLLHRKTYTSRPLLLIAEAVLLLPLLVRPLTRLLTALPARLPGASGLLVRENVSAQTGRTAAIAAPVLVTVALAGSLLGTTTAVREAETAELRARTTADFVITATGPDGLDQAAVDRFRAVPGVRISPSASSAVFVLEEGTALIRSDARAVEPGGLAATTRPPLVAGDIRDLDDRSIVVNDEWARHRVGDTVTVLRGDGSPAALRIAAVMPTGTGGNGVYVTPRNAPGAVVDRIDVALGPGTDRAAAEAALRRAAAGRPGAGLAGAGFADAGLADAGFAEATVRTRAEWIATTVPAPDRRTTAGYTVVLGIALFHTAIALANTLLMAAPGRARELALLRMTGASRPQLVRLAVAEALTAVVVGAVAGAAVVALHLASIHGALAVLRVPPTPPALPWEVIGAATAACALIATVCALISATTPAGGRPVRPRRGGSLGARVAGEPGR